MRATSPKYPQLHVHDAGVRFVGGEAAVTEAQAAVLRQLPGELGVTVEESPVDTNDDDQHSEDADPEPEVVRAPKPKGRKKS